MSKRFVPPSSHIPTTKVSTRRHFRNSCEEVARCQEHSQQQPGDTGKDDPESTAGFTGRLSGVVFETVHVLLVLYVFRRGLMFEQV